MTPRSHVQLIDLDLEGLSGVISSYMVSAGDGFVLIDPGPASCMPALERGLARHGCSWDQLYAVLLTHIHLDHAGAAGIVAERSGAPVFVHPAGAGHLREPKRLIESATRLWGEPGTSRLWGEVRAVDEHQVAPVADRQQLNLGGQRFVAHHSPGHAKHHMLWQLDSHVFCGDVAGVTLSGSTRVFAPVPPPELDFEAWRSSLDRLEALQPNTLWLSHFGPTVAIGAHLAELRIELDEIESLALDNVDRLEDVLTSRRQELEGGLSPDLLSRLDLASPTAIDLAGLKRWLQRPPGGSDGR